MTGRLVHFEVRASDWERAKRFWGSLLGWKFSEWSGGMKYSLIDTGGEPGGGIYPVETPERGILTYFGVDDLDASLARVRELGGAVAVAKTPIPGVGYFARCTDTEGNSFSLFQSDESVPVPS